MSLISLNGNDLSSLRLRLPLYGAWTAEVVHGDPEAIPATGTPAVVTLESQVFVGTVVRVSNLGDMSWDTLIVGGAGGLARVLPPTQFVGPSVGLVLQQALFEAGETADPLIDAALLARLLPSWRRPQRTLGRELDAIVQSLGGETTWRVNPEGQIWIGTDTWSDAQVDDYDVMRWDANAGLITIAAEDPTVLPGQVWPDLGRIGTVVQLVQAQRTRTDLYVVESGSVQGDRDAGAFDALLGAPDLLAFWPYITVSQNADGTLDLRSTDARLPDLSRVPIRFGAPGMSVTVPSGRTVIVGFAGGVETDPYVSSWQTGAPTTAAWQVGTLLELGASPAAGFVSRADLAGLEYTKIAASIANIATAVNTLSPGSVTIIYGTTPGYTVGSTAATKVKVT